MPTDRHRADELEIEHRVMTIAKAIIGGYKKRRFLLQYLTEKYDLWGVSVRQIDNYIKDAKDLIRETKGEDDLEFELDLALNRLDALFTMNMQIQDFREARNCVIDKANLLGIKRDQLDINLTGHIPIEKWLQANNEDSPSK